MIARIGLILGAAFLFPISIWAQDLHVSTEGGEFEPESRVTLREALVSKDVRPPAGSAAARTRWVACIAGPVVDTPGQPQPFPELGPSMPLPDTYCKQKTQIFVALGNPDSAADLVQGSVMHVFADKLLLPKDPRGTLQKPGGTDIWIIARVSYRPPGSDFSKLLFGWTRLVFACKEVVAPAPGKPKETCSYREA